MNSTTSSKLFTVFYRFQQDKPVEIHIIYAESEGEILKALQRNGSNITILVDQMVGIIKENGLSSTNIEQKLLRSFGINRQEVRGKLYFGSDTILGTYEYERQYG